MELTKSQENRLHAADTPATSVPDHINDYLNKHNINKIVNQAVNKILRVRPSDPLAQIASSLLGDAKESLPVFEKVVAKRVYLQESSSCQSVKVLVFLNFQGRTEMRAEYVLTYDQDEHEKQFNYDNKTDRTGLETVIRTINVDVNKLLKGKVLGSLNEVDKLLKEHCEPHVSKCISYALHIATASCYEKLQISKGISKNVLKREQRHTKLLINILNGGKLAGSAVKFAKFYLIIDGSDSHEVDIAECFLKFTQAFRKTLQATKAGEAAFKPSIEGSFFNAFASINESFKAIEDAIIASGANSDAKKVFKLGLNCEGESYFNKDPKDANKYEVEGAKNQHDQDQLADYYIKVCQEHPLVTYIEDPYANHDAKGYQKLVAKLRANQALAHVKVGIQAMHAEGGVQKLLHATQLEASGEEQFDPAAEVNKDKFIIDVANISRSQFMTLTEMVEFFDHVKEHYPEDRQFSFIINDNKYDVSNGAIVDLAFGLGCEFLNMKGFFRPEKIAKVQREQGGDYAKFESVLSKTQNITEVVEEGRNILHIVCQSGFTRYAQLLLQAAEKKGIILDFVDSREANDNQTPLFFAIKSAPNGFPEIISMLIKNGANVNLRDKAGRSAIHYSSEQGQDDILQILIQNGADVNFQCTEHGRTPLHLAILCGQFTSVQILCTEGKAKTSLSDKNGDSLLHYATVTQGNANLYIRYLVERQQLSTRVRNLKGQTPRELAENTDKSKFHRVIKTLLKYEEIEIAKDVKIVEQRVTVYVHEKSLTSTIYNSPLLSVGIPVLLGWLLYLGQQ